MNVTKLSVTRPTLVVVVFTVLVVLGLYSYSNLNYELMPNFSSPVFTIVTICPQASPSEVENSVSKKIEDAMTTLENVETIRAFSQEGMSLVLVQLKLSTNIDYALQEAQRKLNIVRVDMPPSAKEPLLSKFSVNDLPIMALGATSSMNETGFHDLMNFQVKPALTRVEGVGEVSLIGGNEREIRVNVDPYKLKARHLSLLHIMQAVQASNMDFPTGNLKNKSSQMVIRLSAKNKTREDIANIVLCSDGPMSVVKLKDVAEVLDTQKESETLARVNGIPSIGVSIKKQSGANTVKVSHQVQDALRQLETTYKKQNLKFSIPVNTADFTEQAARSVMEDLSLAIILVAIVMLIFIHSLRNAFIVMVAVPLSLVISFAGMYMMNYSLNMMTLLAMSLVIGILVDDAIVVLENIYRHMEMGKDKITATLEGRSEIAYTAVSITLVDVVVFLPIVLSKSIVSPLLAPFAAVVVVSTLLSLLVAFTAVPLLTSRMGKLRKLEDKSILNILIQRFENYITGFSNVLHDILIWAFRHKAYTLLITSGLLIASLLLAVTGFIGTELASFGDVSAFIIQVEMPRDATIEQTNQKVLEIEKILYQKPEVKMVYSTVGSSSQGILGSSGGAYKAEINVKIVEKDKRGVSSLTYSHIIKNELLSKVIGAKITTAITNPFMGGTDDAPLIVIVKSTNPDTLDSYAAKIKSIMESVPGTRDIKSSMEATGTEIAISVDKQRMASEGLSLASVGPILRTAFAGNQDAKFLDGSNEYDINIIYDNFNRQSMNDVSNLEFINDRGNYVKLKQFCTVALSTGNTRLERHNRTTSVSIEGQVFGKAAGDVGDEIKDKIAKLDLPANVSIEYDGDMKYQGEAFGSLGIALLASIFLVYMIMVALYQSYLYPFVVLFSIPLSIVGALLALALSKATLSLFSLLGMVMLVGLVTKNAILVVDFTTHLKAQGYKTMRALLTSTRLRLRPVLMTTMSMIIGLLPIALASGTASEWKNGLAWVLIGGLTSSMFLTLVIVPVVYLIMESIKEQTKNILQSIRPRTGSGSIAPISKP